LCIDAETASKTASRVRTTALLKGKKRFSTTVGTSTNEYKQTKKGQGIVTARGGRDFPGWF
jgi:hypothetical protein